MVGQNLGCDLVNYVAQTDGVEVSHLGWFLLLRDFGILPKPRNERTIEKISGQTIP